MTKEHAVQVEVPGARVGDGRRTRVKRALGVTAVIAAVALVGSMAASAGSIDPGITLTPTTGDRGSTIAVEGDCLVDGNPSGDTARLDFRWAEGDEFFHWWETFPLEPDATWSGDVQVPVSAQSGTYRVAVSCQTGDEQGVHRGEAEFTVSGPSIDPPEIAVDPQPVEEGGTMTASGSCGAESAGLESVLVLSDGDELADDDRWSKDWSGEGPDDPQPLFHTTFGPDSDGSWSIALADLDLTAGTYRLAVYCGLSSGTSGRDMPLEVIAAAVPEAEPPTPVPEDPTFTG
jgi:hypothetical protein